MSVELIGRYLVARAELERLTAKAEAAILPVKQAAQILQKWQHVVVSNTNAGFPLDLAWDDSLTINAREWPTADSIANALAAWHDARRAAEIAWSEVPDDLRAGLQPLPQRQR